MFSSRNKSN